MSTVGQYKSILFDLDSEIVDIVIYLDDKLLSLTDVISPDCTVILILNRISNILTDELDILKLNNITEQFYDLLDSEEEYYDDNCVSTELIDYFLPDYYK